MTKKEFLAMSLPYGLKFKYPNMPLSNLSSVSLADVNEYCMFKEVVPIVRPLSDLTKECVQANYNDGKPFIPIVELAKIAFGDIDILAINGTLEVSAARFINEDYEKCVLVYHNRTKSFSANMQVIDYNIVINFHHQLNLFQQLIAWHFDLIDEDCERLYVTDQFNPYK